MPANGETLPLDVDGTVRGPSGPLKVDAALIRKRDLKPGLDCELDEDSGYNLRLRAYVDAFPGAFFSKPAALAKLLGIDKPIVLCGTTSFAHVVEADAEARVERRTEQVDDVQVATRRDRA